MQLFQKLRHNFLGTPNDTNGTNNKDININRLNSFLDFLEMYWDESQDGHLNFF